MPSKKTILNLAIGIILSVFFLLLAFRKTDFSEIGRIVMHLNLKIILILLAGSFLLFFLRAIRWHYLTKSIKKISLLSLFSSIMIGFMINHTLPLRIGEFVRAYSLARKEKLKLSECLGTIVTERVFDLLTLLIIFLPLLFIPMVSEKLGPASWYIFGGSFLFFGAFVFLYFSGVKLIDSKILTRLIPAKIRHFLIEIIQGLKSLKSGGDAAMLILFSFIFWMCCGYFYTLSLSLFNLSHLPIWSGFIILLFIAFGVALPSSPGYIGSYHYFAMLSLEFFGVSRELALSYAIITHLLQTAFIVAVGIICLLGEGLKLSEAMNRSKLPIPESASREIYS